MWKPESDEPVRGSYAQAGTEEMDERCSGETTIADELDLEDLPFSAEELAFNDPIDKHNIIRDAQTQRRGREIQQNPVSRSITWIQDRLRSSVMAPEKSRFAVEDEDTLGLSNPEQSSYQRWLASYRIILSWLIWPFPSFLHGFVVEQPPPETRRPTDYLDGLRGFASLFVFIGHYFVGLKGDFIHHSFGADDYWNLLQLPFIRTIYSGPAMVAVFFVISGYVLSARCIVAIRKGQHDKVYSVLTSMTFRRGLRLFVPSVAISLVALACVYLGLTDPRWMTEHDVWTPAKEWQHYILFLKSYLFKLWAFGAEQNFWYSQQLWTIPLEFRCSIILFGVILAVARCTTIIRFVILTAFQVYLWADDRWDVALFIAGMTIAELNIIYDERKQRLEKIQANTTNNLDLEKNAAPTARWSFLSVVTTIFLWATLLFGFYLTGYPQLDSHHTPGYDFLAQLWGSDGPSHAHDPKLEHYNEFRFWLGVASILIVGSLSFLPSAQRFFTTGFARYLGKISYALYLVHIIMNNTLRHTLWNAFWSVLHYKFRQGDDAQFEGGMWMGTILYIPCVIWAADIFWRAVDIPSVKFAKWVEGNCFKQEKPQP